MTADALDRLLERFPASEPGTTLPWAAGPDRGPIPRTAEFKRPFWQVGVRNAAGVAFVFGGADAESNARHIALAANAYSGLRSALVALRDELVKTRSEVDRLDGIRGQLHGDLDAMGRMVDEARRLHDKHCCMARCEKPWELGAPAAGREEPK